MNSCRISSMISAFERFCITHACARWCIGQKNYCPLGAFARLTYGYIETRKCAKLYEEVRLIHEKNHHDTAEQGRS